MPTNRIKKVIVNIFQKELAFFNSIKLKATSRNFITDNPKIIIAIYLKLLKLVEKKAVNMVSIISKPSV